MMPPPPLGPWEALFFGLVEGLTEYLPVSSTGHLILAAAILGRSDQQAVKDFEIVIQAGAILAVLGLYRHRVGQMWRGLLGRDPLGLRLLVNLVLAFIPAAGIGFFLHRWIMERLFNPAAVAGALVLGGLVMIFLDPLRRRRKDNGGGIEALTPQQALGIGAAQILALWPGTSRALTTILAGLGVGLTPAAAAEFSFLLALPTLIAATGLDLFRHGSAMVQEIGLSALVIGLLMSLASAALAVKAFVAWLGRGGLIPFGVYRILLALAVFWVLRGR